MTGIISHSLQCSWILSTNLSNCVAIGQFGYGNIFGLSWQFWVMEHMRLGNLPMLLPLKEYILLCAMVAISSKNQDMKNQSVFCYLFLPINSGRPFNTFFLFWIWHKSFMIHLWHSIHDFWDIFHSCLVATTIWSCESCSCTLFLTNQHFSMKQTYFSSFAWNTQNIITGVWEWWQAQSIVVPSMEK